MANRTVKEAKNVHGTNPQYLIEKIIRSRIYDSKYWKEQCFALTAELLVDKAMELRFVGGVYGGNIKPTQFLCLTLKMLQIQPEKDIVVEFIKNEEFKYVRALGAFYLRLTGAALDCYKYLEPLYIDNRKLRRQNRAGQFEIVYMDEYIDELLRNDRVCDIILPRIQKRSILEENNEIEPKVSVLDEDLDDELPSDDEKADDREAARTKENNTAPVRRPRKARSKSRSPSRERERERDRRPGQASGNSNRSRDYYDELEEYDRQRNRARNRDPQFEEHDRRQNRDRERQDRDRMRDRYGERDRRNRDRDRERDWDRERERERGNRHDHRERDRERERERERERDSRGDRQRRRH